MSLNVLLLIASSVVSTTYGHGELMCGDSGRPVPCDIGAITASGVPFRPDVAMVALAAPEGMVLTARYIGLKVAGKKCKRVLLADKMNERYIGIRGFDLTPAAVELLTEKPATKHWSGQVKICQLEDPFFKPLPKR